MIVQTQALVLYSVLLMLVEPRSLLVSPSLALLYQAIIMTSLKTESYRIFISPSAEVILVDHRIKALKTCVPYEYTDTTLQISFNNKDNEEKRYRKLIKTLKKYKEIK